MKNLILKIKSYQEDVTYLTLNVYADLSNDKLKKMALDCKKIVDGVTNPTVGSPNIMRFENNEGIYNYEMKQLVSYP
jgi:hypothetical protein